MNEAYPIIPAHAGWCIVRMDKDRDGFVEFCRMAVVAWEVRPVGALPICERLSNAYHNTYSQPGDDEWWIIVDPTGRASHDGQDYEDFESCVKNGLPSGEEV